MSQSVQRLMKMAPTETECTAEKYVLGNLENRQVVADFSAGELTSDGGVVLLSKLDKHYRISERLAACFEDQRDSRYVQHDLVDLLSQRLYGLAQGYEDLNDHEHLRHERIFAVAVGKLESGHSRCGVLGGKSTLNRVEQAMHKSMDLSNERYVKFVVNPDAMAELLTQVSLEQMGKEAPHRLILDMDVSNDETHGEQEGSFFNGYYNQTCYAPLFIFSGRHLLASKLRSSNVDPAAGALEELKRIIAQVRRRWPKVQIIVRGDSAYGRDDIMSWCEGKEGVEFVLAHSSNKRLRAMTWGLEQRAKAAYEAQRQEIEQTLIQQKLAPAKDLQDELDKLVPPQIWYQSLDYRTADSWARSRRVVCKLTYSATGAHRHFVVSSFTTQQLCPRRLHNDFYCPRGEMENQIKQHQLHLFSERTSTHEFESNQLRLWFSSFVYVLMQALRQQALAGTSLADAQLGTIRLKLLKLGAQIRVSVRRVLIAFSSHSPAQQLFRHAWGRLQLLPRTG